MPDINAKKSIQEAVYCELRRAIMSIRYPPGTTMSTQEIATKLNVSRTPVREAFLRLQGEGLVEMIPQRETMVSLIDLKRVEEERFIRESLEVAVVEPFLQKCTPADFQRLKDMVEEQKKCWEEKRYSDFIDCDNEWHEHIFFIAERSLAWETMMMVNGHYNRIRVLSVQVEGTSTGVIQQHLKIINWLESGCANEACREIQNHVTKLKLEATDLIHAFPNYFKTEHMSSGWQIGTL